MLDGKNDPHNAQLRIALEKPRQHTETQAKQKISQEFVRYLQQIDISGSKMQLLISFIENKVDYRPLIQIKHELFLRFLDSEIPVEAWNLELKRFRNLFPGDTEK